MARKSRQSFLKRQRERNRVEKATLKRLKRQQRRQGEDVGGAEGIEGGVDEPGDAGLDADRVPTDGTSDAPPRAATSGTDPDGQD